MRRKSGDHDGEDLPPDQQGEEKQAKILFQMVRKHRSSTDEKNRADARDENRADDAGDDHADEIETAAFLAETIAKDAPTKLGDQADLFEKSGTRR